MKKTIFFDIDGVIYPFVDVLLKQLNRDVSEIKKWRWNFWEDLGYTEDGIWAEINSLGEDLWTQPNEYPWTKEIINLIYSLKDKTNLHVNISTTPGRHPSSWSGKKKWLDKYCPGVSIFMCSKKFLLGGPNRLLIDDSDYNCKMFVEYGGEAFLFPQPWNESWHCEDRRIELLKQRINGFTNGSI